LDDAEALVNDALAAGQNTGTVEVTLLRAMLGRLAFFRGELRAAEASLREAVAIARAAGLGLAERFAQAYVVLALAERGELAAADAELGELPPAGDATLWICLQARARVRRAQHRFAEALEDAELAWRERPQSVLGPAMLALALHTTGERARSRALAADAVAHARRWAVPSTLGMALRIAGLVTGDLELLREAVATLAPSPRRLEHARALVDLGAALRRANRRAGARGELAAGMELADRCGAAALAARARAELVACGARPRRLQRTGVDALTPSELRVAQLAATGLTNREIAQALFVTRKTVETHLAGVYRKLGVNERGGLPAKLREGVPDAKPRSVEEALAP
jgi:DNA-binding CsgD family transcriptional regulator